MSSELRSQRSDGRRDVPATRVPPAPVVPRQRRRRDTGARGAKVRASRSTLLLTAPALCWYAVFSIGPLFAMFYLALHEKRGFIFPAQYAGLDNFTTIAEDDVFWVAVKNTAIMLAVSLPVMMPAAFALGYYLSLKPRGHNVLRVLLFTPALISMSVRSMIFLALLSPKGAVNGLLESVGVSGQAWLAQPDTALEAVIVVEIWSGIGFTAVLFAARLSGISSEVYDAARLDGAGHSRRTWQIAFPIVRDYFGVLTMLQFLWMLFSSAGTVLLLTRGGPGNASTTLSYLIYDKAFIQSQVGYSQAVGVVLFGVGVVGLLAIRRCFRASY
jgi:multiple sugar transport system permease protein